MACALLPPSLDPEQAKLVQRLLDKLKYCKEVLLSICNASFFRLFFFTLSIALAEMYDLIGPSNLHGSTFYHHIQFTHFTLPSLRYIVSWFGSIG